LVALLVLLIRWKKKTFARIGDPGLVGQLIRYFSPRRFLIKSTMLLLAFVVIILGATNPQKPGQMQNVSRKGVDVMFVLDVSKSMLARDIKPSRLDRAKQLLQRLIDKMENDRIGLILFAGRAYLQMPLTTDHGAARMYIQDASPNVVPTQGTVIAEALKMANQSFNSKEHKYKAVILVSDGEDHDPEGLKTAQLLAHNGIMINTVGIGSPDGSPIVDPATNELKKDENGNTVISKLNETELQQLADAGNGRYIRLDNLDDAVITMSQAVDSIEKKALSDAELIDYKSFFQWLLGAALLLLAGELFVSERKKAFGAKVLTFGCLMSIATGVSAQSPDALIRKGNRLYNKKQLDASTQQYEKAVQKAPENATAHYNLGDAQYRNNKFDDASKSFDASATHSPDTAMQEKSLYNKGVAMIRQQKLRESIEAWKNALRLNPSDTEARENLQKALMEMKKQQSQEKQKNQKDQKTKKDQKDDKKSQEQQEQPKPQPSRLNKQQVEQLLKALQQKENELQEKMNQSKVRVPNQPEKDW
jgi:Ca-activated chloride channel family protein